MTTSPCSAGEAAEPMTRRRPIRSYGPVYPPRPARASLAGNVAAQGTTATRAPSADDSHPEMWSRSLAAAIIDCVEGRRELRSIQRWLSRELYARLAKACSNKDHPSRRSGRINPHSSRVWQVDDDTYEIAVTLWDRDRLRGVAMRLERIRLRWTVTAVELG